MLYAPLFYKPPTPRRVLPGVGGGVYKIWPRIIPQELPESHMTCDPVSTLYAQDPFWICWFSPQTEANSQWLVSLHMGCINRVKGTCESPLLELGWHVCRTKLPPKKCPEKCSILRAGFRQNGIFADFYFWAAWFFRGFSRRIVSPHFCGKKVPRKILQENPRENPPRFIQQKSSNTFLQIGRGNNSMQKWFEYAREYRKSIRNVSKKFEAPVLLPKIFSPALF